MRSIGFHKFRLLVVFALFCALANSGFAHRFVSQPFNPALAAFVNAGGSLDDICGDTEGSSHGNAQTCEACRLVNAAVLLDYASLCTIRFYSSAAILAFAGTENFQTTRRNLSHPVRGPPVA